MGHNVRAVRNASLAHRLLPAVSIPCRAFSRSCNTWNRDTTSTGSESWDKLLKTSGPSAEMFAVDTARSYMQLLPVPRSCGRLDTAACFLHFAKTLAGASWCWQRPASRGALDGCAAAEHRRTVGPEPDSSCAKSGSCRAIARNTSAHETK